MYLYHKVYFLVRADLPLGKFSLIVCVYIIILDFAITLITILPRSQECLYSFFPDVYF